MTGSRIDVHFHYLPDFYREAMTAAGLSHPGGIAAVPAWSEADMLATMDKLGIERAYLSVSSPGVHFGDDSAARALARRVNEEGARLKAAHPGRVEFFASTPLPRRRRRGPVPAPHHAGAAMRLRLRHRAELRPPGADDRVHLRHHAHRTNMVWAGVLERCPKLRVIVPHAGAALPILAARIDTVGPMLMSARTAKPPSMREALRRLHFDLAGAPVPEMLIALLSVADPDHIHYGSDWPYTPAPVCEKLAKALDQTPLLDGELRAKAMRINAERLFARQSVVEE